VDVGVGREASSEAAKHIDQYSAMWGQLNDELRLSTLPLVEGRRETAAETDHSSGESGKSKLLGVQIYERVMVMCNPFQPPK